MKLVKLLVDNVISAEDYRATADSNRIRIEQIESQACEQINSRLHYLHQKDLINKLSEELDRILSFNELDDEIIHRLIEKIEVKDNQDVVIHYCFKNPFIV